MRTMRVSKPVEGVVGHGHGFLESFGFVVHATRPHGVDVPPILFVLGMDLGVAVNLACGRDGDARTLGFGQPQAPVHPERPHLQRLNGDFQVVDRAGRRGKMQDVMQGAAHVDELRHVLMDEAEIRKRQQVVDVAHVPRDEVVHGNDLKPFLHETVAQVRAQKPRCTRDEHALGFGFAWHHELCHDSGQRSWDVQCCGRSSLRGPAWRCCTGCGRRK